MSVFQTVLARCYKCGRTSVDDGAYSATRETTINMARDKGWTFRDDGGLDPKCPRCNQAEENNIPCLDEGVA